MAYRILGNVISRVQKDMDMVQSSEQWIVGPSHRLCWGSFVILNVHVSWLLSTSAVSSEGGCRILLCTLIAVSVYQPLQHTGASLTGSRFFLALATLIFQTKCEAIFFFFRIPIFE